MGILQILTYILNLLALTLGTWLGFYVISHSPRRLISWLTGLSLWSLGGFFLNMLLAITPPPIPDPLPAWQALLFPFWASGASGIGIGGWLNGWLATPAVAFWHHLTVLLREKNPSTWKIAQIIVVYLIAAIAIYAQINTTMMFSAAQGNIYELDYLQPGIYFAVFMSLLAVLGGISVYNLIIAALSANSGILRKQFFYLAVATGLAALTGPISLFVLVEKISIPRVINTLLLTGTIILIGYSVARYSALIEGRIIRRDLAFNAAVTMVILLVYLAFIWVAVNLFHVPESSYIFVAILAIVSHSLVDFSRRYLEKFFFQKEERELRMELQKLSQLSSSEQLSDRLEMSLSSICSTIRASYGIIFLIIQGEISIAATYKKNIKENPARTALQADDIEMLDAGDLPSSLFDACLLVPLFNTQKQLGAIILGPPINGLAYPEEDQELLLETGDRVAETISLSQVQDELISEAAALIRAIPPTSSPLHLTISPKTIEDLLRNVLDYSYLGSSDFAKQQVVERRLTPEADTHIDRGKIVYHLLEAVIEKLRPESQPSRSPPPREWHPYLILKQAYFEDKLNREIIAELYISEGTFNRTRRAALRSVARALEEIQ